MHTHITHIYIQALMHAHSHTPWHMPLDCVLEPGTRAIRVLDK